MNSGRVDTKPRHLQTNWKVEIEGDGGGSNGGSVTYKRRLCMNSGRVDTKLRHLQTNKNKLTGGDRQIWGRELWREFWRELWRERYRYNR